LFRSFNIGEYNDQNIHELDMIEMKEHIKQMEYQIYCCDECEPYDGWIKVANNNRKAIGSFAQLIVLDSLRKSFE
jgi:hypothetical protein